MSSKILVFVLSAAVWALASASAVFWLLPLASLSPVTSPGAGLASRIVSESGPAVGLPSGAELAVLLGQAQPQAEATAQAPVRFKLMGVVAEGRRGVALLALDGQPAKPYRVGSRVDESTVLQSVGLRHVILATDEPGAAVLRLELAGLSPAK